MKKIICSSLLILLCAFKPVVLTTDKSFCLKIKEPSDICTSADGNYFSVSDNGILYKLNESFEIVKTASYKGLDFEAVYSDGSKVYVSDESLRQILIFDATTLELLETKTFVYSGGRNLGMESLTFNSTNNTFLGFTEKEPCILFQFDKDLNKISERSIKEISEVSSITFHNNALWVLSDEEMSVTKLDPSTFQIIEQWKVPVLNPEGICFSRSGSLLIMSDDEEKIYELTFPNQ